MHQNRTNLFMISANQHPLHASMSSMGPHKVPQSLLTTYHYHLTSAFYLTSLCFTPSCKASALGGFAFDLFSPFQGALACYLQDAERSSGELCLWGISHSGETKPSSHTASEQKKGKRGQREYEAGKKKMDEAG